MNLNHLCQPCHKLCKTCYSPKSTDCYSCIEPDYNVEKISGSTCKCKAGYFFNKIKILSKDLCQPCYEFCKTCKNSATNCQSCKNIEGVNFVSNKCICNAPRYTLYSDPNVNDGIDDCISCHPLCNKCNGPEEIHCLSCLESTGAIFIKPSTCKCQIGRAHV